MLLSLKEIKVLLVAIDHMIEHLDDVSYCVDAGMYADDVAKQIRLEDKGCLDAAHQLKKRCIKETA